MSVFDDIIQKVQKKEEEFLGNELKGMVAVMDGLHEFLRRASEEVAKFKKGAGKYVIDFKKLDFDLTTDPSLPDDNNRSRTSIKENVVPLPRQSEKQKKSQQKPSSTSSCSENEVKPRPKRTAFLEASQMINQHTNLKLNNKLRRPIEDDEEEEGASQVLPTSLAIKSEKLSIILDEQHAKTSSASSVEETGGTRNDEMMPAPKKLPPRKGGRPKKHTSVSTSGGAKVKMERDSDVQIQSVPVPVVSLSDSEEERSVEPAPPPVRMTRTKTRQKQEVTNAPSAATALPPPSTNSVAISSITKVAEKKKKRPRSQSSGNDTDARSEKRSKSSSSDQEAQEEAAAANLATQQSERSSARTSSKDDTAQKNKEQTEADGNGAGGEINNATFAVASQQPTVQSRVGAEETTENCKAPSTQQQHQQQKTNAQLLNATVVVQNPKFPTSAQNIPSNILDEIMTDDESIEEQVVSSPPNRQQNTNVKGKSKAPKQVFSPFLPSPVKKKVEAFEKLNSNNQHEGDTATKEDQQSSSSSTMTRSTRTKTRAKAAKEQAAKEKEKIAEEDAATEQEGTTVRGIDSVDATVAPPNAPGGSYSSYAKIQNSFSQIKSNVKEKARMFTPMATKTMPTACSTMKIPRALQSQSQLGVGGISNNESVSSQKSASALKASQAEFRERERRRKEKEMEALRKREALMQAQIEEKKRRREEKQLKAQQQREVLEKEKQKALEVQKLKEERHKQLLLEQEEKKQKQREEAEKKRYLAKVKALEEKKREEKERLDAERKAEEVSTKVNEQMSKLAEKYKQKEKEKRHHNNALPVYMTSAAPVLPTPDCYDSDDERYNPSQVRSPAWAKDRELKYVLLSMMCAGEKIKNTFFSCQATTPDLQDIFETIDANLLKRTSSACWQKPPKYSILPGLLPAQQEDDEVDV